jgi:hypothetical protein
MDVDSPRVLRMTALVPILPRATAPSAPVVAVISEGKIPGQMQLTRILSLRRVSSCAMTALTGLTGEADRPTLKKGVQHPPTRELSAGTNCQELHAYLRDAVGEATIRAEVVTMISQNPGGTKSLPLVGKTCNRRNDYDIGVVRLAKQRDGGYRHEVGS